jgi:hypothetical protein
MTTRLRRRWDRCPDRCRAVLRWLLPLLALAVLVAMEWWRLQRSGPAGPVEARNLFRWVGGACAVAVVAMLAFNRKWTVQGLGLLAIVAAVAGFMLRLLGRVGDPPREGERDLIQALFDVGAPVLLVGLLLLGVARIRGRGKDG